MLMRRILRNIFLIFLIPAFAEASITINEIMYDVEGSDTDREWIELKNNGSEQVVITEYKLRESDTNHKLELFQGSENIPPNGFAIIADAPTKFLSDHPNFKGSVFDSSFSLSNTGETLSISKDESVIDSVIYSDAIGAKGDGKSLNRVGNTFIAKNATPGAVNEADNTQSSNEENNTSKIETSTQPNSSQTNSGPTSVFTPQIYANAGEDKVVLAGVSVQFSGQALGNKKEPLQNAVFQWTFGDGSSGSGKNVSHKYQFPGKYIVSLNVSNGEYSQGDNSVVSVISPKLIIEKVIEGHEGYVEVRNGSEMEVDISGIILRKGDYFFAFPKATIISSKSSVKFPNSITKLESGGLASLQYENGTKIENNPELTSQAPSNFGSVGGGNSVGGKLERASSLSDKKEVESVALVSAVKTLEDEHEGGDSNRTLLYALGALGLGLLGGAIFVLERGKEVEAREADQYIIVDVTEEVDYER
jgi:hypothetical protein